MEFDDALKEFYEKLLNEQEDLDAESKTILYDNLWDLMVHDEEEIDDEIPSGN